MSEWGVFPLCFGAFVYKAWRPGGYAALSWSVLFCIPYTSEYEDLLRQIF